MTHLFHLFSLISAFSEQKDLLIHKSKENFEKLYKNELNFIIESWDILYTLSGHKNNLFRLVKVLKIY